MFRGGGHSVTWAQLCNLAALKSSTHAYACYALPSWHPAEVHPGELRKLCATLHVRVRSQACCQVWLMQGEQ